MLDRNHNRSLRLLAATVIAVLGLGLAGCAKAPAEEGSLGGQDAQPAKLIAVPGTTLHRVILTPQAVAQVGIETTPIQAVASTAPTPRPSATINPAAAASPPPSKLTKVPVTAVIYDPEGGAWTYTIPGTRTYLRVAVVVQRVEGDTAYLSSGPPVGTLVVSQGAPELLGAEYGVGEE